MREFAADTQTTVHPQTVIEHFGKWNAAKRQAGLVPRRFATREELLGRLRALGEELGRTPTARDFDARKGAMPSKSLLRYTFGSLPRALQQAGFDVDITKEQRLARVVEQGMVLARHLRHLPSMTEWKRERVGGVRMSEWQARRAFGDWPSVQAAIRDGFLGNGGET